VVRGRNWHGSVTVSCVLRVVKAVSAEETRGRAVRLWGGGEEGRRGAGIHRSRIPAWLVPPARIVETRFGCQRTDRTLEPFRCL
jgi:hypothetical protein